MGILSVEILDRLSEQTVTKLPPGVDDKFVSDAFLLFPQNRAFLVGETKRLAGYPRTAWLIGLLLLFTLFASLFLFVTLPDWQHTSELDQHGQIVEARVESRRTTEDREGSRTYYVTYSFQISETGRYYAREQRVTRETYDRLDEAAPVKVRYLPENPDRSALDDDPAEFRSRTVAAVLTAVAAVAVLIRLVVIFVRRQRHDVLVRRGRVLHGEVVHFGARTDTDGRFHVDLRYRVVTPSGRAIIEQAHRRADELRCCPRPAPGDPVAVLYLSDRRYRLL